MMTLNKQKKLIFLNRYFYPDQSATSQLLTDLAFDLAQDHEVHILTSCQRYDDSSARLTPFETIHEVHIHRVWTSHFGRQNLLGRTIDYLSFYLAATWKLWKLTTEGDIVIIKTDPPLMSVVAGPIIKWHNAKLINWLQDIFPEIAVELKVPGINSKTAQFLQWLRNKSLFYAKQNVVLGELMASYLGRLGVAKDKITIIHNWADGKDIQPIPAKNNPLRTEWQLQDKFVVGYSGNMGRAHEFTTILEAAQKLINEKQITFLFIGSGSKKAFLEQEVKQRQLNNIIFKPYQPRERLGESLTVPDVHLISLHPELEGFIVPSKFYGIIAAGRAVLYVGDKMGEIPKILSHYECGITINIQDSQALADSIHQLFSNPKYCRQMGIKARQLFEQQFDKSLALAHWRSILEKSEI